MKSIQDIIDEALVPKPRIRSGKWNPSSFGYCFRSQFWNRKDEPKSNPPDKRSMRVFEAGKMFHNFVQKLIVEQEDCQVEVDIESDDIKGFADIVRTNEVVEMKSVHSKSFWWLTKKNCDIKAEKYSNWLQVMYYTRELKKDFGRLVFISKDDLAIQEYVQPLDDYWLSEIENELIALRALWDINELPIAAPRCDKSKKGYWHCNYCSFLDLCIRVESEAKREHPNLIKEKEE